MLLVVSGVSEFIEFVEFMKFVELMVQGSGFDVSHSTFVFRIFDVAKFERTHPVTNRFALVTPLSGGDSMLAFGERARARIPLLRGVSRRPKGVVTGCVFVCDYPLFNRFQDFVHSEFYVKVVESQEADAEAFYFLLTRCVFLFTEDMTHPINFNGKHQLRTKEIYNKIVNRFLTMKVVAAHLLALQLTPEQYFGQCAVVAKVSCSLFEFGIVWEKLWLHTLISRSTPLSFRFAE